MPRPNDSTTAGRSSRPGKEESRRRANDPRASGQAPTSQQEPMMVKSRPRDGARIRSSHRSPRQDPRHDKRRSKQGISADTAEARATGIDGGPDTKNASVALSATNRMRDC